MYFIFTFTLRVLGNMNLPPSCSCMSKTLSYFLQESVVEIEYVEKHPTPRPDNFLLHDDWVSSVSVCKKWYVIKMLKLSQLFVTLYGSRNVHLCIRLTLMISVVF